MSKLPIESLESRVCLSSPAGGDVAHFAPAHFHHVGRAETLAGRVNFNGFGGAMRAQPRSSGDNDFAPGRRARGAMPRFDRGDFGGNFRVELRRAVRQWVTINIVFRLPPTTTPDGAGVVDSPPPSASPVADQPTGVHTVLPPPAPATVEAASAGVEPATVAAVSVETVVTPPDQDTAVPASTSSAVEELLGTDDDAATVFDNSGTVLASATQVADFAVAAIGSIVEHWTSNIGVAGVDWASVVVPSDVATRLVAPVAETVASVVAPTIAAYEIVHMGSPFTLLADSLATFVDESAAMPTVVADAQRRGPWALTFGVMAADLFILSYVYRRKSTARRVSRVQFAAAGAG